MFDLDPEHREVLENPSTFQFFPIPKKEPIAVKNYSDLALRKQVEKQLAYGRRKGWLPAEDNQQTQFSIAEVIAQTLGGNDSDSIQFSAIDDSNISDVRADLVINEVLTDLGKSPSTGETHQFSSHQSAEQILDEVLRAAGFKI